ncbi:MAG TPA: PAS domain S-box protein, partial [Chthoniobacterales bacterium]|nr:PAS domain S-box protein [Chthoniobacterales bacterium]
MHRRFSQLAEFIETRLAWISAQWLQAIGLPPGAAADGEASAGQLLVNDAPAFLRQLAATFRARSEQKPSETLENRLLPPSDRLLGNRSLAQFVREFTALRQALTGDLLNEFAAEMGKLDVATRREAERIIHAFVDAALAAGAQEFATAQEKALATSEQNSQAILDSALDSIIVMGEDGRVREWNPAAERMFGYTREQAVGQELASLVIPPELRARHRAGLARYLSTGEGPLLGRRIEVNGIRADGSTITVELAIAPHRANGKAIFTAYLRDVTARVQQERRRAAQYAIATLISGQEPMEQTAPRFLEAIAQSGSWVSGALWLVNPDDDLICYTTWRAADKPETEFERDTRQHVFSRGAGIPGRVLASGQARWITEVGDEPQFTRAAGARASGLHTAFLFPLLAPGGPIGVIEVLSEEVLSPDDDLMRLAEALGRQIGLYLHRNKTEEQLRQQKEAAEAANQAKDRFMAALSHELRTPLNPVLMWACAAIDDEKLPPQFKEGLRMVCRNVELEARLIEDLLDLTRINRGKFQLHLQPCDAAELLQHAIDIVRSQITAKNLQISTELHARRHTIMADPTRIQQVFWNLLNNAIKFTPEGGRITLRSYDAGADTLAFQISDTGRGVDPELMPRLFTAFEQGRATGEGLGLGLAICKSILQLHGGKIAAANLPDRTGAIFTIELPTTQEAAVPPPPRPRKQAPAQRARALRILIVEDHENTAAVMSKLLSRDGHQVTTAATVREAIQLLKTQQFDLLLSDLGLPDGNGF